MTQRLHYINSITFHCQGTINVLIYIRSQHIIGIINLYSHRRKKKSNEKRAQFCRLHYEKQFAI